MHVRDRARARRRLVRTARTVALAAVVAAFALLPLYGDPRPATTVAHPEWARMILRGLDLLEGGAGLNDTASQVFATLSGRDSRSYGADRYVRGANVEVVAEEGRTLLRPTAAVGEAVYPLAVARGGDYRLRLHIAGPSAAEAEIAPAGGDRLLRAFTVPSAPVPGWVDAGSVHLDPGAYDTAVLLPSGSTLERIELAPPCLHPIEPRGGWKPAAVATVEDVAVTVLQALDLELELPPAAAPIEFRGGDLVLEDGTKAVTAGLVAEVSLRSGPGGARVTLLADLPEPGLHTLSVFGLAGGGQRWEADGCQKSLVCPAPDTTARWRVVLSGEFAAGPHYFAATLGPDTVIERVRLERKKATPPDYVATLERLGLALGPEGPVSRERAIEARRFLERRRAQLAAELCGDILAPGTLIAELAAAGPGGPGGAGPGEGGGGGGEGGGGRPPIPPPPVIPPLPPASPDRPVLP